MPDKTLDTKGLNCPLPILKVKKAIREVPVGGTLEVLATDPGSEQYVALPCGHRWDQTTYCWDWRSVVVRAPSC